MCNKQQLSKDWKINNDVHAVSEKSGTEFPSITFLPQQIQLPKLESVILVQPRNYKESKDYSEN